MDAATRTRSKDHQVLEAITHNLTPEGTLQVSLPRLAQLAGVGTATVSRAVPRLEAHGLIRVHRHTDPMLGTLPNTYTLP